MFVPLVWFRLHDDAVRAGRSPNRVPLSSGLLVLLILGVLAGSAPSAWCAPSSKQRSTISMLKRKATRVESLCRQSEFGDAAEELEQILGTYDQLLTELQRESGLGPLLEPLYAQLIRSHARLELEGLAISPLRNPDMAGRVPSGSVSFQEQVAGILVAKCGRCHITSARGNFQVVSYNALMRGSQAGAVVVPMDADGSRLIEVIESGDMPRGGLRVSPEELMTLKTWITEGALYDGDDPEFPIAERSEGVSSELPRLELLASKGNEQVKFARDLAPVLAERCTGCHGDGQQNSGQLDLSTFDGLLRGGENGPILVPGDPAESLLIGKLRGTTSGVRMPRGQPPLDEALILQFETWIAERATFDGRDPRAHMREVASLDRALRASHEDLRADREERARRNWSLGFPNIQPHEVRTTNFFVVGNVGERTLADFGRKAEEVVPQIANLLKIPAGKPVVHGGLTLYVFASRYDYSEFGMMVERRQLPTAWRGHWRYSIVDAYAALQAGPSDGASPGSIDETLLLRLIAANHLASLGGDTPRWFAEGAARMAVSRLASRDSEILEWDRQLPEVLKGMTRPDDFLTGQLGPEPTDLASYRFVRFLAARDARRFQSLLKSLREGEPFATAFQTGYQATAEQLAPAWVQFETRAARRR